MRRLAILLLVLPLAACGSRHAAPKVPVTPATVLGPGARVLYGGGNWAVVTKGNVAVAAHLVRGVWKADRSGAVKLEILAPHGKATTTPQIAVQVTGPSHIVDEGLWVDGVSLTGKGGGLTPEKITVYGSPEGKIKRGKHRAVAFARTEGHGTAVTWTFTVV